MGIGLDVVFIVHASSCLGRPNEGIQGQETSIIKSDKTKRAARLCTFSISSDKLILKKSQA